MTNTNEILAAISRHIDESPAYQGISTEAADWRRTMKMVEEVGEAITAYAGTLGENPRKGVTHTPADVDHEHLDVAVSALGALMHRHGNDPDFDVIGALAEHIRTRADRFGIEHKPEDPGEISDGFHTFNQLYRYRLLYNAALFVEWAERDLYVVHKSRRHHDGEYPFGSLDWFIVVAELPTGQISNHYHVRDWSLFSSVPEQDRADEFDGHTAADVEDRLSRFLGAYR